LLPTLTLAPNASMCRVSFGFPRCQRLYMWLAGSFVLSVPWPAGPWLANMFPLRWSGHLLVGTIGPTRPALGLVYLRGPLGPAPGLYHARDHASTLQLSWGAFQWGRDTVSPSPRARPLRCRIFLLMRMTHAFLAS
jgi:hypothetical protein